ncbi:hypothetical protein [Ammoniphilus resinae]|uniref:Uncharacterized protein n=1 Tax=Ammoniphilus resinae TaxID=861532 RepID=A0ABS4GL29_9BACL|nr:hypothetical protein [Ammoniphilus resinae]MBP1930610.1 hypothetical protein [Ammoniphilus resinae]
MLKSLFKKVFSSPAKSEEEGGVTATLEDLTSEKDCAQVTLKKDWIESLDVKEIEAAIEKLEEKGVHRTLPKIRIRLEPDIHEQEHLISVRNYLDYCEQEVVDLTLFIDKTDEITMEIYRNYLLPESIDHRDAFVRERCLMIYEACVDRELDPREEMEKYLFSLNFPYDEQFFVQFEAWRSQILTMHQAEGENQSFESHVDLPQSGRCDSSPTMIEISKEEIENENIAQLEQYLKRALETPEKAKSQKGDLLFSFYGYAKDEDLVKLMNRKEIKEWASLLLEKHPYIVYFLNDEEYPMTRFLTSLVVTTEEEDHAIYYNEMELSDFRSFVSNALVELAQWLGEDLEEVQQKFNKNFE